MRVKQLKKLPRMKKVINVHIAEVKIARKEEVLKAILGSCIGIGIIWRERQICGLAHCLLPMNPSSKCEIGARYVDQAVRSLLALMKIRPSDYKKIEVVVAGGGNMTAPNAKDESTLIGMHNYNTAMKVINELGLNIVHKEAGGNQGRNIFIDASDYSYRVEKIPSTNKKAS